MPCLIATSFQMNDFIYVFSLFTFNTFTPTIYSYGHRYRIWNAFFFCISHDPLDFFPIFTIKFNCQVSRVEECFINSLRLVLLKLTDNWIQENFSKISEHDLCYQFRFNRKKKLIYKEKVLKIWYLAIDEATL